MKPFIPNTEQFITLPPGVDFRNGPVEIPGLKRSWMFCDRNALLRDLGIKRQAN